jgi:hypothetical protein
MVTTGLLLALAVIAIAAGAVLVLWRWRTGASTQALPEPAGLVGDDPQVVREFKNVFFNRTQVDRERIISFWVKRSRCSRGEAMRLAVEDWRKDQRTWR